MKNIRGSLLFLICLLMSPSLFAYVSGKATVDETLAYCPERISCTEAGNPESCKYIAKDPRYWNKVGGSTEAPERAGVYKLFNVAAGYHWPAQGGGVACIYENIDLGVSKMIALYAKSESNLEAHYNKTTKWVISDKGYPFPAYCRSSSPQSCPLAEQSALEIFNNYDKDRLVARANLLLITDQIPSNVDLPPSSNPGYGKIAYENALGSCGSSKECKIDIFTMAGALVGSILVDMDNKMKILKIIPSQASGLPAGVEIKKIEYFNTIEINKLPKEPPPSVPAVEIYNYINSSIVMPGLGVPITPQASGKIFYDRILPRCEDPKQCTLQIKTTSGGILGSMTIDTANNMSISSVHSMRPSEIIINLKSYNTVEIKYPSFN